MYIVYVLAITQAFQCKGTKKNWIMKWNRCNGDNYSFDCIWKYNKNKRNVVSSLRRIHNQFLLLSLFRPNREKKHNLFEIEYVEENMCTFLKYAMKLFGQTDRFTWTEFHFLGIF